MPAKQHRITQADDFRRIIRHGRRVGGSFVVTHAVLRPQGEQMRFGYITSKKVGGAVTRNLIRRRLQGISNLLIAEDHGPVDIVFRVLPAAATSSYDQLYSEVRRQLDTLYSSTNQLTATRNS